MVVRRGDVTESSAKRRGGPGAALVCVVALFAIPQACGGRSQAVEEDAPQRGNGGTTSETARGGHGGSSIAGSGTQAGNTSVSGASAITGGNVGAAGASSAGGSGAVGIGGAANMAGAVSAGGTADLGGAGGIAGADDAGGATSVGGMGPCPAISADPAVVQECRHVPAQQAAITDFSDWSLMGQDFRWGGDPSVHTLTGSVFTYGPALQGEVNPETRNWTVSGIVDSYAGFGLWFDVREPMAEWCGANCLDTEALACDGIRFVIFGSLPSEEPSLDVLLHTWSNTPVSTGRGGCVPTSEANTYVDCVQPALPLAPRPDGFEIQIPFSQFTGGKPVERGRGDQLVGVAFQLPWSDTTTPYEVSFTVSDFAFVGGPNCVPPRVESQ